MRRLRSPYEIALVANALSISPSVAQEPIATSSDAALAIEQSRAQHEKEMLLGGTGFGITLVIVILGYKLSSRIPAREAVLLFLGLAVIAAAVLLGMFNTEAMNTFIPVLSGLGGILLGLAGGRLTAGVDGGTSGHHGGGGRAAGGV